MDTFGENDEVFGMNDAPKVDFGADDAVFGAEDETIGVDDTGAFMRGFKGALQQQFPEDLAYALEGAKVLGIGVDPLAQATVNLPGHKPIQMEQPGGLPEVAATWLRDFSKSGAQYQREVPSYTDIENLGDVGTYIAESAGSGAGSTVPSIAGGAAGAVYGARGRSPITAGTGALGGALVPSAAQNFGQLYGVLLEEGVPKDKAAEYAAAATGPIAALDVVAPTSWLARLSGEAKREAIRSLGKRIAQEAGKGFATEAATEAVQEGLGAATVSAATGKPLLTSENIVQITDAFLQGGFGGATMGGTQAVVPDRVAPEAPPPPPPPPGAAPAVPTGQTVGIQTPAGPIRVRVEAEQDGNVFYTTPDGVTYGMPAEDFTSSIVPAPPAADEIRGDATTVPEPTPRPEPMDYGDINDFDPNREAPRAAPPPPSPQQAMPLADTRAIDRAAMAAREFRKAAVEAQDAERRAYLNQQADALDNEAMDLRRQLAARSDTGGQGVPAADVRARAELGRLGEAAPTVSEAVTGPVPVDTRQPQTPLERAAPAVSEATTGPVPQTVTPPPDTRTPLEQAAPAVQPPEPAAPPQPKPTVEQLVRARTAKLNDPASIARKTGMTVEEVRAELNRIAGKPGSPIRQVRGKVTTDPKTGQPVQSKRSGMLTYAPQRTAPMSILEALSAMGGVQDRGGDLASMGADTWHRGKPGKRPLINERGIAWDELGDWAEQEGYLPKRPVDETTGENYHRDPAEVLAMIDRELKGQKQFALDEIQEAQQPDEPTETERREYEVTRDLARLQEEFDPMASLEDLEAQLNERLGMMNAATVDEAVDMLNAELDAIDRIMEETYDGWNADAEARAGAPETVSETAGRPETVGPREGTSPEGDVDRGPAGRGAAAETEGGVDVGPVSVGDNRSAARERPVAGIEKISDVAADTAAGERAGARTEPDVQRDRGRGEEAVPDAAPDVLGASEQVTEDAVESFVDTSFEFDQWTAQRDYQESVKGTVQAATDYVLEMGNITGWEYVVSVNMTDGTFVQAGTSDSENAVWIGHDAEAALKIPGRSIRFIHNHPSNSPISPADISLLGHPGAESIVEVGLDGYSSSAALSDGAYDFIDTLEPSAATKFLYETARSALDAASNAIRKEPAFQHMTENAAIKVIGIATNRAMADGGILVYDDNNLPAYPFHDVIRRVTDAASKAIRTEIEQVRNGRRGAIQWFTENVAAGDFLRLPGRERADGEAESVVRQHRPERRDGQGAAEPQAKDAGDSGRLSSTGPERSPPAKIERGVGAAPVSVGADRSARPGERPGGGEGVLEQDRSKRQDVGVAPVTAKEGPDTLRSLEGPENSDVRANAEETRSLVSGILDRFRRRPGTAREAARAGHNVAQNVVGPPELAKLGRLSNLIAFAATVASKDTTSARYYTAEKALARYAEALTRDGARATQSYYSDQVGHDGRAKINKVLEYDRLQGVNRQDTGNRVVARMPDDYQGQLGKPGEVVTLNAVESRALADLRKFFDARLTLFGKAMARQFGWTGPFDEAAMRRAVRDATNDRSRNEASRAIEIYQMIEEMRRAGYVPFARYGDTKISIRPKPREEPGRDGMQYGRPVHVELVPTSELTDVMFDKPAKREGRSAVQKRRKELEKDFPPDQYDYEVTPLNTLADVRKVDLPAVEKMFMMINMKTPEMGPKFYEEIIKQIFDERKSGFRRRSNNVPGYSVDFERSIADYIHQTSNVVARMELGKDVNRAFEATQSHQDRDIAKFWKDYKDYVETPGDDYPTLRKIAFWSFIWGSLSSAGINLTQTPLVTVMQTGAWAGPSSAPKVMNAFSEVLASVTTNKDGLTLDWQKIGRTDAERRMIAQLRDEGVLDPIIARDLQGYDRGTSPSNRKWRRQLERGYEIGASAFNTAEMANRASAALAAFRLAQNPQTLAKARKVYSQDAEFRQMVGRNGTPLDMARFMVDETQFMGGKRGRPRVMRGVGAVVLQWKQYQSNWLRLFFKNMTRMGPEGKLAGTAMLLGLVGAAGMLAVPFAEDALDFTNWAIKTATGIDPLLERRMAKWLRDAGMGEVGAEITMRGPSREYLGVDLSSRIGMGEMAPDGTIENAFPLLGATVGKLGEVWQRATSGQPLGAAAALLPKGAADIAKATAVFPEEGYRTKKGDVNLFPQEITAGQQLARLFGFQPTEFSRKSEYKYAQRQLAAATQEASSKLLSNVASELALATTAKEYGDEEAYERHIRRYTKLLRDNAEELSREDVPGWLKIPQPAQRAIKMRLQQIMEFDQAILKRTGKMKREEMMDYPLPKE